ncbi:hypothetical protein [Granulicella tundricola]|uniref:Uncharacterized protein n=1 Tax=Granulicella tundricola (strain ATCC BAA-1859 / DSM 23138 / MP5ACTX9) TaxID=1198114 RepID=E8WY38_GRATM|nr:hypothetical protein [Granulicella tundricola]ADW67577.1 hypothetical protein AciX9_0505 [Granulicella tundricola MP5ACTX9]
MRCEQVFRANDQIGNRYELCRLTARMTRRLHFVSGNTHDAIEDAFVRVGQPLPLVAELIQPVLPVAERL